MPDRYIVINHEEQYSLWPGGGSLPKGWRDVGVSGTKERCLEYIEEVWTDMRPKPTRRAPAQIVDKLKLDR